MWVSGLRGVATLRGPRSRAAALVDRLIGTSEEFRELWERHEIGIRPREVKHFRHPEVGALELTCQQLVDPERSHLLLVYTAEPGSASHEKLQVLASLATRT
jgi:hypothetical protein